MNTRKKIRQRKRQQRPTRRIWRNEGEYYGDPEHACYNKAAYPDWAAANEAVRQLAPIVGHMTIYPCPHCGKLHTGHKRIKNGR